MKHTGDLYSKIFDIEQARAAVDADEQRELDAIRENPDMFIKVAIKFLNDGAGVEDWLPVTFEVECVHDVEADYARGVFEQRIDVTIRWGGKSERVVFGYWEESTTWNCPGDYEYFLEA
ncbi:hypothetical protein GF380_00555 [Candidatus Uhrbacteria bacterium]|nr:hypothetical protein [Candidatus Uhrbacteria bacterium]